MDEKCKWDEQMMQEILMHLQTIDRRLELLERDENCTLNGVENMEKQFVKFEKNADQSVPFDYKYLILNKKKE